MGHWTKFEKKMSLGWHGFGGSVFQWHPELKIGFAFIPTVLNPIQQANERGAILQQLVKDCVMSY